MKKKHHNCQNCKQNDIPSDVAKAFDFVNIHEHHRKKSEAEAELFPGVYKRIIDKSGFSREQSDRGNKNNRKHRVDRKYKVIKHEDDYSDLDFLLQSTFCFSASARTSIEQTDK